MADKKRKTEGSGNVAKQRRVRDSDDLPDHVRLLLRQQYGRIDGRMREYEDRLCELGASECWHKHGTFKDHLVQVWRVLALWKQPTAVCRLGLFHSTYSNSFVNLALLQPDADRGVLRTLVGEEAEQLVHLFCIIDRHKMVWERCLGAKKNKDKEGLAKQGLTMKHIRTGEPVFLSREVVAIFLLMTVADFTDQWFGWQDELFGNTDARMTMAQEDSKPTAIWPGTGQPGMWMSRMSELCALVREWQQGSKTAIVLPLFDRCTARLTPEDEVQARDLYWSVVTGKCRNLEESAGALKKAIKLNRFAGEFHLVLAQICLIQGDFKAALAAARSGRDLLLELGTAYDKRVAWDAWVAWARVLIRGAKEESWPGKSWGMINLGLVDTIGPVRPPTVQQTA